MTFPEAYYWGRLEEIVKEAVKRLDEGKMPSVAPEVERAAATFPAVTNAIRAVEGAAAVVSADAEKVVAAANEAAAAIAVNSKNKATAASNFPSEQASLFTDLT
jgi:hypothetical protein